MKRLACLLLTLLVLVSACAAAESPSMERVLPGAERGVGLLMENGRTRTVYFLPVPGAYYDLQQGQVDALEVPPVSNLRAKSSKSWLQVTPAGLGFRWGVTKVNTSQKTRAATLTLTGSGYQSKLKVKQLGTDRITSLKRSKKKVTVNLKLSNSPAHTYTILRTKLHLGVPVEGTATVVKEGEVTGSKLTFTVKKGYQYAVYASPAVRLADGTFRSCDTAVACITVKKTTGTQRADYILKLGSDGKLN